jgi:hypothetical protein
MRSRTVERDLRAGPGGWTQNECDIPNDVLSPSRRSVDIVPSTSTRADCDRRSRQSHRPPGPVYKQDPLFNSREARFPPVPRRRWIKMSHYSEPLKRQTRTVA